MPGGEVLEFTGVSKRFGAVAAVTGFTAQVEPGRVTGFLGPNGAGKTTTLRILLGLVRASDGTATIGGTSYAKLRHPLQSVGAVLEASSFHPGRSAANHLKIYARAAGLPVSRVDATLGQVGLADVAGRKVGGYSLGMRQRLGLAYALLGDPGVLVLDEPTNGLDPEGIKWMRGFLRTLAAEGRTVLVSSHLLAEVQQTVDALLIISRGRLVYQGSLEGLTDPSEYATVVDAPDRAALTEALRAHDISFEVLRTGLSARGIDTRGVGEIAASAGIALSSLQRRGPALEEVFLDLVSGARVHPSADGVRAAADEAGAVDDATPGDDASEIDVPAADTDAPETESPSVVASAATDDEAGEPAPVEDETPPDVAVEEPPIAASEDPALDDASPSTAAFAVASTGVIDVIPPAADEPHDGDDTDDRAWDDYVKTESDVEADAFFSAFDDGTTPPAADAASPADDSDAPTDDGGSEAPVEQGEPADEEQHREEGEQR